MPTKHIDDATALQLDDLYVRCVTLTQQPVKEVEVLRLAIQTGIGNITDNDILSSMTVKDSVWQRLAEQTWAEVTAWWPESAITARRFETLATVHSATWQQYPAERCRTALRAQLSRQLRESIFCTTDQLFGMKDLGMSDEEIRAAEERDAHLNVEYLASLPALAGRLWSTLSEHEQVLACHYSDQIGFTPHGQGDFVVCLTGTPSDE
ncbi:hypothetical protein J1785_06725 [Rahnella sp. SL6]|uniref:hypothetical protein n=1 Tax=Rahnella perminowiae TaxID=2816244 RepID=UPI001C273B36|nr:hypothetical protein [Rahnella perminowiae]MBU9809437.1 hypothetical protein [Rahnella perminowiae]